MNDLAEWRRIAAEAADLLERFDYGSDRWDTFACKNTERNPETLVSDVRGFLKGNFPEMLR